MVLLWIIGATVIVSLISVVGVFTLSVKEKVLNKFLVVMVALAAGALLGGAFLHLVPEAIEEMAVINVFLWLLGGFCVFFVLEKILWHHCHKTGKCDVHEFTYINLIGDGVHNFIDGLLIAAAFMINIPLGLVTTLAIIFHEVPQEIGDFGVLVYGGFSRKKALKFNFLSALTAILGALVGFALGGLVEGFVVALLPITAGGFAYIACSDLIPELHKEPDTKKSILSFIFFLVGIAIMLTLTVLG